MNTDINARLLRMSSEDKTINANQLTLKVSVCGVPRSREVKNVQVKYIVDRRADSSSSQKFLPDCRMEPFGKLQVEVADALKECFQAAEEKRVDDIETLKSKFEKLDPGCHESESWKEIVIRLSEHMDVCNDHPGLCEMKIAEQEISAKGNEKRLVDAEATKSTASDGETGSEKFETGKTYRAVDPLESASHRVRDETGPVGASLW